MKNKFGFVLIKPQLGENIGASARSLKNFGFNNLSIVSPKQNWPNPKTKSTSVGAYDLIKKTKIYNKTIEALSNFDIVFALSARKRDINKKHISVEQFLKIISKKNKKKFGFMFGPEASGLSNEDISYSNYILQIPTSKKFKSMNLSHSLTIICYEIFKLFNYSKFKFRVKNIRISSKKEIDHFMKHLIAILENKNFFIPEEKKHSMLMNINNLFYRLEPSDKELRVLASIISSLSKNNNKA
ncbi:MAG: RNA methyltransferase [Pelagibacteraceae bacterium]